MTILVLGGGASGMAAAYAAAHSGEHDVMLLERQNRLGRKLLSTGNGRCNLSNLRAAPEHYHGGQPEFCRPALERFGAADTLDFFRDLGLVTVAEDNGKVYPYSDQANSVLDVLRFALERPNLQIYTDCEVKRIRRKPEGWLVKTDEGDVLADKIIVACGGLASGKLGGTDLGYRLLESVGHKRTALCPALVQLVTQGSFTKGLKGVRAQAHVSVWDGTEWLADSEGEVQFTEVGISGPAIFEISRAASTHRSGTQLVLDLLPQMELDELTGFLRRKCDRSGSRTAEDLLTGILHNRLGRVLVKAAGVSLNAPLEQLTSAQLADVAATVKRCVLTYAETQGMDCAQVTAGGIRTEEFDPDTLESRLAPGVYACGEVLDVDGDCGGYNLQWAWSSGRLAGASAAGEVEA